MVRARAFLRPVVWTVRIRAEKEFLRALPAVGKYLRLVVEMVVVEIREHPGSGPRPSRVAQMVYTE